MSEPEPSSPVWSEVGADLAARFGRDYWVACVADRRFPSELWQALGENAALGVLVPPTVGGHGAGLAEAAALTRGLASAGFPILSLITSVGLAIPAVAHHGRPVVRSELVPDLCRGTRRAAFAITEPDAGSDILALSTTAEPDGDAVILNGTKAFTSGAADADFVMVVARTHDAGRDRTGFTVVLVPTDTAGVSITPLPTDLSIAETQSRVHLDDVVVPLDFVIGEPTDGLRVLAPALAAERVLSAALGVGLGHFCLRLASARAQHRSVGGVIIGTRQGVQHPLAHAHVDLAGAELLVSGAADSGDLLGAEIACVAGTNAAFAAADAAVQVAGGWGYTSSAELQSMFQLARLLRSAPVHTESSLNSIAQQALGLPVG